MNTIKEKTSTGKW